TEDGIRDRNVTGVQTCALPISSVLISILNTSTPCVHRGTTPLIYVTTFYLKINLILLTDCYHLLKKQKKSNKLQNNTIIQNNKQIGRASCRKRKQTK